MGIYIVPIVHFLEMRFILNVLHVLQEGCTARMHASARYHLDVINALQPAEYFLQSNPSEADVKRPDTVSSIRAFESFAMRKNELFV